MHSYFHSFCTPDIPHGWLFDRSAPDCWDRYSSRNITNLKGRLKSINSLNDGKSYVANAMNAIDSMLRDVENAIRSRNDRIYEINEQLRIKKRRMESK